VAGLAGKDAGRGGDEKDDVLAVGGELELGFGGVEEV
jgi:hypothetical protein